MRSRGTTITGLLVLTSVLIKTVENALLSICASFSRLLSSSDREESVSSLILKKKEYLKIQNAIEGARKLVFRHSTSSYSNSTLPTGGEVSDTVPSPKHHTQFYNKTKHRRRYGAVPPFCIKPKTGDGRGPSPLCMIQGLPYYYNHRTGP